MSLKIPVLLPIEFFDAREDHTFFFEVPPGGDRVAANELVIKRQRDNTIVYLEKTYSYRFQHTLKGGTLTNGEYYSAIIGVYDESDQHIMASRPVQFNCYSKASIQFTNFPETGFINNSSFEFEFHYTQAQGEKINEYHAYLYDEELNRIYETTPKYVPSATQSYDGSFLINGFSNDKIYYVELVAYSQNGIMVSTGRRRFAVKYNASEFKTLLELSNDCEKGCVVVNSNVALVEGKSNPNPPVYINNKEVDLTAKDSWVSWGSGFTIGNDFLARAWFRKPNPNSVLLKLINNDGDYISVMYVEGYKDVNSNTVQSYLIANVFHGAEITACYFSNFLNKLSENEYYIMKLMRTNGLYQLELQKAN